jgi:splicing factor 3A subunit 2
MVDRQNRVGSRRRRQLRPTNRTRTQRSPTRPRPRNHRHRQRPLIDVQPFGTYECKLCLTFHPEEANYLLHTQGTKHQAGLARRAAMEAKLARQRGDTDVMMLLL